MPKTLEIRPVQSDEIGPSASCRRSVRTIVARAANFFRAPKAVRHGSPGRARLVLLTALLAAGSVGFGVVAPSPTAAAVYLTGEGRTWAEHNVTSIDLTIRIWPVDDMRAQDLAYQVRVYSYATKQWTRYPWVGLHWDGSIFNTAGFITDSATFSPPRGWYYLQVRYAWLMTSGWAISNWEAPCVKGYWTTACMNPFKIY